VGVTQGTPATPAILQRAPTTVVLNAACINVADCFVAYYQQMHFFARGTAQLSLYNVVLTVPPPFNTLTLAQLGSQPANRVNLGTSPTLGGLLLTGSAVFNGGNVRFDRLICAGLGAVRARESSTFLCS
jgi:hypothetical protein